MLKLKSGGAILIASFTAVVAQLFPVNVLRDRDNYLIYAYESIFILKDNFEYSLFKGLFNEPIFLLLNHFLSFFLDPASIPAFYSSFSIFLIFLSCGLKARGLTSFVLVALLLLCSAQFFHLGMVVLRQGLCSAVLLFVVCITNKRKWWIFACLILSFVHTLNFIILGFLILDFLLDRFDLGLKWRVAAYTAGASMLALVGLVAAEYLGVRQATEEHLTNEATASGAAFILWGGLFLILISRGRSWLLSEGVYSVALIGVVSYLVLYFFSPIAGRLVISFLPFVYVALANKSRSVDLIFVVGLLFINIYFYQSTLVNNSFL
ncbi:EpsG family protein [Jeongeupia sp. HS-3]|uniref:EpsG family protein n=1 Tax=Jeongeupia sp. HS-3 TaxID=1009682 RepID=UPI00191048F8|nr:EpsG family protein [Jeongeupia sp. HS-3]